MFYNQCGMFQKQMFLFENKKPYSRGNKIKISIELDRLFSLGIMLLIFMIMTFTFGYSSGFRKANVILLTNLTKAELRKSVVRDFKTKKKSLEMNFQATKESSKKEETPIAKRALGKKLSEEKIQENIQNTEKSPKYTIQLASYTHKNKKIAQEYLEKLRKKGIEAFTIQNKNYVVLCAGGFQNKKEGELLLSKLRREFKDSFIRRYVR